MDSQHTLQIKTRKCQSPTVQVNDSVPTLPYISDTCSGALDGAASGILKYAGLKKELAC